MQRGVPQLSAPSSELPTDPCTFSQPSVSPIRSPTASSPATDGSESDEPTQDMDDEELESLTPPAKNIRRMDSPTDKLIGDFDAFYASASTLSGKKRKRGKKPARSASRRMTDSLRDQAATPKAKRRKREEDDDESIRQEAVTEVDASQLFAEASF